MDRLIRVAAVALTTLLVLASCGDDEGTTDEEASGSAEAVEVGEEYVRALGGEDGRSFDDAIVLTAAGSVADGYARHTEAVNAIRVEAGEVPEAREVTVEGDTVVVTFTTADGSIIDTDWSDFEIDGEGLLTDFTIDGQSLDDRLVVGGEPVVTDDVAVTVVSAFELVTNDSPVVVVEIDNGSDRAYSPREIDYVAPDGTVEPTAPSDGAAIVPAGADNRLLLIFGSAPFGGDVVIRGDLGGTGIEHELPLST
jgi:hypothetical protein